MTDVYTLQIAHVTYGQRNGSKTMLFFKYGNEGFARAAFDALSVMFSEYANKQFDCDHVEINLAYGDAILRTCVLWEKDKPNG